MNINELKSLVKETVINESSLSRIQEHISNHECAIVTANRNDPTDGSLNVKSVAPSSYQPEGLNKDRINKLNNRDLKATLLKKGYGVTQIEGSYIEDYNTEIAKEVKEDSLLVVNLNDEPDFVKNITDLGKHYTQDSVLIIPKGGKDVKLVGTNHAQFPGLDNVQSVGDLKFGKSGEFMSKIRNRPMTTNEGLETYNKLSRLERMAVTAIAKKFK